MRLATKREGRRSLAAAISIPALLILNAAGAAADGSQNLYPSGASGSRANTEWRTSTYGGGKVFRRTLIQAYVVAGEYLLLGSSAVGSGAADIRVWDPGQVTGIPGAETLPAIPSFSCATQRAGSGIAAQGQITSRAEELAGPDTVPAGGVINGYTPCTYQAPSSGVYSVAMLGPSGFSSDLDAAVAADVSLASPNDFNATQNTSVAAWDVTVRADLSDASSTKHGRVFAYVLALFTGGNGLPVDFTTYPVTSDGYRYQVNDRGMDPNGWVQFVNQVGFLDPDGQTPLYHDALAANSGTPAQLTTIQGGVLFARPDYPIFLQPPDFGALTALGIPLVPTTPVVSAISFAGGASGSTTYFKSGGTFSYTSNVGGVYQIVISRDGVNFDPTKPQNRVLRGVRAAGTQTVVWNGKDNSGAFFPTGPHYPYHFDIHGGEYHFPTVDDENDTQGGPTVTLLNPPGGVCPPFNGGCSSGFYDDRGYTTSTGHAVGTPGSVLCGLAPPNPPNSDPINGFDTSSNQRAFGTVSGGNSNVPCTGSFGDTKGLDLWTYYPSQQVSGELGIIELADIGVTDTVNNPYPAVGTQVTFTITATNHGPSDATGVAVTNVLPAGLTYVTSSTATGSFDPGTGIWTIGALAVGDSATLTVTATVTQPGTLTDTATKTAENQPDNNPANDTASAAVNGPGPSTPNTGAGSMLQLGILLAVVGLFAVVAGLLRRRALGLPDTLVQRSISAR